MLTSILPNYLNIRYSLRNLSDEYFLSIIDQLAEELENHPYTIQYPIKKLEQDWKNLIAFKEQTNTINSTSRLGMKLCEHFFPNFFDIENNKGESFSKLWKKDNIKKILIWNRKSHSTPYMSELRRGVYFCLGLTKNTMFRPQLAKLICNKYKPDIVLDPCAGWGGRLLGTVAHGAKYIAFEPNTTTYDGLQALVKFCNIQDRVQLICGRNEEAHKQVGKKFYENMRKDQDYRNSCLSTEEESKPMRSSFAYKCIPYGVDVTYIDETYDTKKLIDTFKFILQDKTIQHRTPIILIYDTPDNQTSDANIKLGNVDISGKDLTRIFDMYSENRKLMIFTSNNSEKYISAMKDRPDNTVFFGCKEGTTESLLKFYTADKNDVLNKTLFLENHSAFDKNGFIIKVNENNASPIYITDIFQNAHSGKMYV